MSGAVVFRRALSIINEMNFPEVATRDLIAVLWDSRPGPLDVIYQAGLDADLERGVLLDRAAAIFFNHSAGQVADDIADGDCTYLDEPLKTGPAAQFIFQNLFFATLAASGVGEQVIASAGREMARAAGPQHVEVRTTQWTAPLAIEVAEGLAGLQYSAYFRVLWAGSKLEAEAATFGRALGVALHVATDVRTRDPRFTTLSAADKASLIAFAGDAADLLRRSRAGCAALVLESIDAALGPARE